MKTVQIPALVEMKIQNGAGKDVNEKKGDKLKLAQ